MVRYWLVAMLLSAGGGFYVVTADASGEWATTLTLAVRTVRDMSTIDECFPGAGSVRTAAEPCLEKNDASQPTAPQPSPDEPV